MYRCIKLKHIEPLKYLAITIATTIYWFLSFSLPPQTQPQNYTHWEGETRSEVQLLCHLKTWKTTKMFFSHSQLPLSIYLFRGCGEPKPVANTWRGVETLDSSLVHHRATYNHSHQHTWSHMMHMWSSYRRARAITTSSTTRPQNKLFLVYTFSSICTQWNVHTFLYCTYSGTS